MLVLFQNTHFFQFWFCYPRIRRLCVFFVIRGENWPVIFLEYIIILLTIIIISGLDFCICCAQEDYTFLLFSMLPIIFSWQNARTPKPTSHQHVNHEIPKICQRKENPGLQNVSNDCLKRFWLLVFLPLLAHVYWFRSWYVYSEY